MPFKRGDSVKFRPDLTDMHWAHGEGPFVVESVSSRGALFVHGISTWFDPDVFVYEDGTSPVEDLSRPTLQPGSELIGVDKAKGQDETRVVQMPNMAGVSLSEIENLLARIDRLLPPPEPTPEEGGFLPPDFYRLPITGDCWCGKPLRIGIGGIMCENLHRG